MFRYCRFTKEDVDGIKNVFKDKQIDDKDDLVNFSKIAYYLGNENDESAATHNMPIIRLIWFIRNKNDLSIYAYQNRKVKKLIEELSEHKIDILNKGCIFCPYIFFFSQRGCIKNENS